MNPPSLLPTLTVEPHYRAGFPLVAAVTFAETQGQSMTTYVPDLSLTGNLGSYSLRLSPARGSGKSVDFAMVGLGRFTPFSPRERRRYLLDLSVLAPGPGDYVVELELEGRRSAPVGLHVLAASPAEEAEGDRLRSLPVVRDDPGFRPLLVHHVATIAVAAPLSPEAAAQLAPYLYFHRALYGPEAPAKLDPLPLMAMKGPVWEAEAALWRCEIATEAGDAVTSEALARSIRQRWPDVGYRLPAIAAGKGVLTETRGFYGPGSFWRKFPDPPPYATVVP